MKGKEVLGSILLGAFVGIAAFAFSSCGGGEEKQPPHEHSYTSEQTKDPTCTEEGVITYACGCGDTYTEEVSTLPHTYDILDTKHCADCGISLREVEEIVVAEYVRGFDLYEFRGYDKLKSIVLPDTLTFIAGGAFENCTSLEYIVIPDSVTAIHSAAFEGCNMIIYCEAESQPSGWSESWNYSGCTVVWNYGGETGITEDGIFWAKTKVDTIHIISYIGDASEVRIPSTINGYSVASIGECAFNSLKNLKKVVIPDSVASIGLNAFNGCRSLTSVVIGDGVMSISDSTFYGCSSLTSVVIGEGVTLIDSHAFYGCSSLTSVYYKGTASDWTNIWISGYNDTLKDATRYYYSETSPALNADGTAYNGNYWHYDESGEVVVWVYTKSEE